MVQSTWNTWFVGDKIEAADPDGLSIWYLGCNGFILRTASVTMYLDPYFGDCDPLSIVRMISVPLNPADATVCDGVLITHKHIDHIHPPSYGPLVEEFGPQLYARMAAFEEPDYEGDLRAPASQRTVDDVGDTFEEGT